jgi:hypothetical protein
MGGKKKSLANRLARMSDEERARYLQHKADIEEEARRRKEQLIAIFMKVPTRVARLTIVQRSVVEQNQTRRWLLEAESGQDQPALAPDLAPEQVQGNERGRGAHEEVHRSGLGVQKPHNRQASGGVGNGGRPVRTQLPGARDSHRPNNRLVGVRHLDTPSDLLFQPLTSSTCSCWRNSTRRTWSSCWRPPAKNKTNSRGRI